jgi:transposase
MPSLSANEPDFAAFIAIDWADREHAWAMQVAGGPSRETGKLAHTPDAIELWAMQWAARFPGRRVAVALEQSRGALLYALQKYPHLVLYSVHPSTSYAYRKAMFPSGSKDDPRDADLLLDLLTLHRRRLRALHPDTEQTRKLQALVEKRRQLVDERTAQTNRITDQLKLYFPQVLDWFDELHAPITVAFLRRWPTLPQLQQEDPVGLRNFFHQHGSRSQRRIDDRLRQIRQATPALQDPAVVEPAALMVRTLLSVVEALNEGIRALENNIEQVASAHPDYAIFCSFPAAGPTMAPRLLAAFGSQRERFGSAGELQTFSGIAPVIQASGKQSWTHFRWACPKFLRQTFHEYAGLSIQSCSWARTFYEKQKAKGKAHHAAVRSLAFKWIRILFRCWQSSQPYQDDLYQAARDGRAVPIALDTTRTGLVARGQALRSETGKHQNFALKSAAEILKSLMADD